MGVGSWELLTCCGAPSGGLHIKEDAFNHQPIEILLGAGRCDPLQIVAGLSSTFYRFLCRILQARASVLPPFGHGLDLVGGGGDQL